MHLYTNLICKGRHCLQSGIYQWFLNFVQRSYSRATLCIEHTLVHNYNWYQNPKILLDLKPKNPSFTQAPHQMIQKNQPKQLNFLKHASNQGIEAPTMSIANSLSIKTLGPCFTITLILANFGFRHLQLCTLVTSLNSDETPHAPSPSTQPSLLANSFALGQYMCVKW